MPIRINFLAERQVAEELRRRDPVKRVAWAAIGVLALAVLWTGYVQMKLFISKSRVADVDARFKQIEASYSQIRTNQSRVIEYNNRLSALRQLAESRFIWGNALNALQYTLVKDVSIRSIKTDQTFVHDEGTPAVTTGANPVPQVPATCTEDIKLSLRAVDSSSDPGNQQVFALRDAIGNHPFFSTNMAKVGLAERQREVDPTDGRTLFNFTIDVQFPEKVRSTP